MVVANAKVWAACAVVLYAKFFITTTIQGGKTFRAGARPPEDAKLSLAKRFKAKQTYGLEPADAKDEKLIKAREAEVRWRRIILNDLETIPIGMLVFGAGVLTEANATVHLGAMATFTAMRCLHTYVYANQMQPHRALAWFGAHFAVMAGAANVIVSLLN